MTAQPHPNHQLLTRIVALEEKVNTEFDVLRAKVEEYRLLCENTHLHTLVVIKEQRITQLEQQLEGYKGLEEKFKELEKRHKISQKQNKVLEEKFRNLEKRHEEMKVEVLTGNIAGSSNMEPQVTNTDATENVVARVEQRFKFTRDGNVSEVKSILASGVDVNVLDDGGLSPLHRAAQDGHVRVCELLLDKGADVNVMDICGYTPLHWAGYNGHVTVCERLLDKGADVNAKDPYNQTSLHYACSSGHLDIVKLLIARGASVSVKDVDGRTPLSLALEGRHTSVCEYLEK